MGIEEVPDSMTACQIIEFNKPYKIHSVPSPKDLGPNELLVKIAVASLCHTDGMVSAGIMGTKLPCIASHEGSGTIVAMGSAVSESAFKPGDRVMNGLYKSPCGVCADCQGPEEYRQYCSNHQGICGVTIDGNFAEYITIDANWAAKLPDKVSFGTAAPMACAGCTVWRGIKRTNLIKGQWIAFVGGGGALGHLGIQFAKVLGLMVISIDARDEGLQLSKEVGADIVLDVRKGNDYLVSEIAKVTNGDGADATCNLSDAKTAAATACKVTKKHGLLVQIAQPETVDIPFAELVFRDVRIIGSLISTPLEAREMLDVVAEHNISVKLNKFDGLKEIPKLIEYAEGGKMSGKGVVIVDPEQVKNERKDAV